MKIGLSTWSLLGMEVNAAVRSIGDAGFDYIELWGEVPHAYHEWTDRRALKDTLSAYDMALTMHAPFTDLNPAVPFQPVKGAVEKTLEDFVKFSDFLGASVVTVHPGSVHNELLVRQSAAHVVATIRKMVKAAGGRLAVSVENQTKGRSKYHFPLASNFESLDLILADVEDSVFTLDTGHAHANGQDPLSYVRRAGDKLVEVHLSDNAGQSDDHLIPGEGTAPIAATLGALNGSDVLLCLELNPHKYSPDQVLHAASETKLKLGASPKAV